MKNETRIHRTLTVEMKRSVKTEHESGAVSWRSEPDGTLTGTVTLIVDTDALLTQLGEKALRSKTKRSAALSGLVRVVVDKANLRREGRVE